MNELCWVWLFHSSSCQLAVTALMLNDLNLQYLADPKQVTEVLYSLNQTHMLMLVQIGRSLRILTSWKPSYKGISNMC